ncbi:MAG: hypothetical protein KDD55_01205 [Bdellovibrionales bacterium]|nr:hypothetical protein [Bdellovibrionales bacterium]
MKQGRPLRPQFDRSVMTPSQGFSLDEVPFVLGPAPSEKTRLSSEDTIAVALALYHLLPQLDDSEQDQTWKNHSRVEAISQREPARRQEAI